MKEDLLVIIDTIRSIYGFEAQADLVQELLDVAEGLKARAESGGNTDNTELMQRARLLLD